MSQSFRDLQAWQRAMQLTVTIYRLTQGFPREETYGLTSHIRRAAVPVPRNVAEGQGRLHPREFLQFLGVARGSICELQTQLEIARSLQFGNPELIEEAEGLSHKIGKMLYSLLKSIKDQSTQASTDNNKLLPVSSELSTENCML